MPGHFVRLLHTLREELDPHHTPFFYIFLLYFHSLSLFPTPQLFVNLSLLTEKLFLFCLQEKKKQKAPSKDVPTTIVIQTRPYLDVFNLHQ